MSEFMFQAYAVKGVLLCISGKNFVCDFSLDVHGLCSF